MAEPTEARYSMRKRRRTTQGDEESGLDRLLAAAVPASKIVVFSGSGLSATSGMSTFSTKGGLYERAQRKFKLQDGKTLFTYSFYDRNRLEALAFFANIYLEATRATAAPGHHALAQLQRAGRLQRHYTLNIDGLAEKVGMDTWHPESNPHGCTVEMHGNVHNLVCVECGECSPLTEERIRDMKACRSIPCLNCPAAVGAVLQEEQQKPLDKEGEKEEGKYEFKVVEAEATPAVDNNNTATNGVNSDAANLFEAGPPQLRFKVMLYEDAESEVITPEEVMDLMEEDTKAADLILWVGISFQQSASTAYFRKVRHWLQEAGKLEHVVQAVINPSDEALWNLMTASSNQHELNVVEVLASSDEILPLLAAHVAGSAITVADEPPTQQEAAPFSETENDKEENKIATLIYQENADVAAGSDAVFTSNGISSIENVPAAARNAHEEEKEREEKPLLAAASAAVVHVTNEDDGKVEVNGAQGLVLVGNGDAKLHENPFPSPPPPFAEN